MFFGPFFWVVFPDWVDIQVLPSFTCLQFSEFLFPVVFQKVSFRLPQLLNTIHSQFSSQTLLGHWYVILFWMFLLLALFMKMWLLLLFIKSDGSNHIIFTLLRANWTITRFPPFLKPILRLIGSYLRVLFKAGPIYGFYVFCINIPHSEIEN